MKLPTGNVAHVDSNDHTSQVHLNVAHACGSHSHGQQISVGVDRFDMTARYSKRSYSKDNLDGTIGVDCYHKVTLRLVS